MALKRQQLSLSYGTTKVVPFPKTSLILVFRNL